MTCLLPVHERPVLLSMVLRSLDLKMCDNEVEVESWRTRGGGDPNSHAHSACVAIASSMTLAHSLVLPPIQFRAYFHKQPNDCSFHWKIHRNIQCRNPLRVDTLNRVQHGCRGKDLWRLATRKSRRSRTLDLFLFSLRHQ
jgi:hypothetical protein